MPRFPRWQLSNFFKLIRLGRISLSGLQLSNSFKLIAFALDEFLFLGLHLFTGDIIWAQVFFMISDDFTALSFSISMTLRQKENDMELSKVSVWATYITREDVENYRSWSNSSWFLTFVYDR